MHVPFRRLRPTGLALSAGITAFAVSMSGLGTAHAATTPAPAKSSAKTRASSTAASTLSVSQQALKQAHSSGKAVPISSATTPFDTLTAEPNGQLALTEAATPQRAKVDGTWKPLDASLTKNANGSYSPAVSSTPLTFSGGGSGPLVTMANGGYGLSLTLPASIPALPAPTVAGDAATYRDVLPGVNLTVTADSTGGFSEVFEVENATAAANPALAALTFGTKTTGGVSVTADKAGNLTARDPHGQAVFTAPAPQMWDSATSAAADATAVTDPHTGAKVDKYDGAPLTSTATVPGAAAHTAGIGVSLGHGALTLTPDKALLEGKSVTWPLYIDPTWASTGEDANNWTYTSSEYNTTSFWDIPTSSDFLHAGYINPTYDDDGSDYTSNDIAYFQYNMGDLSSLLSKATVNNVYFYTEDEWSDSCTAEATDLYYTGPISSSTTASNAPGWGTQLESQSFAHGYDSSCAAADVTWNSSALTSLVQSQATGGISHSTTLTLALRADNESNPLSWRKFNQSTAELTIDFDQKPNTPTAAQMSTSPATPCTSAASDAVGLGPMTLYSYVSSPMGAQNPLEYDFELWNTSTGSSSSPLYNPGFSSSATTGNDSYASVLLSEPSLAAWAGNTVTEFSWRVQVSDGLTSSNWSTTCSFYYDASKVGQPGFSATTGPQCGTTLSTPAGTATTFTVDYNDENGAAKPTTYRYQLNTAAPLTVAADSNGDGNGQITVTPTQRVDTLTVTEISAGGNIGQPAACQFIVNGPASATDRDMNDDGIPDLLTAGQTDISSPAAGTAPYAYSSDSGSSVPAGLYLADGVPNGPGTNGTGPVQSDAADIGANGNGFSGETPSSFDGEQIVTGQFYDFGFNDVLAYNPGVGAGEVIQGNGNGQDLEAQLGVADITAGALEDANNDNPAQLVNAYSAASSYNAEDSTYPDLIGLNGDSTNGYYLDYYLTGDEPGTWGIDGGTATSGVAQLSNPSPDGTTDWQDWVISSTQVSGQTDLVLWKPTSGELCLWQNTQLTNTSIDTDPDSFTGTYMAGTGTLTYTGSTTSPCGQELSASFDTGAQLATLEAANITGSGIGVWAVTPSSTDNVTWTTFGNVSTSGVATSTGDSSAPQSLVTTSHSWELNDEQSGTVGTAADSSGGLTLTNDNPGATGPEAVWNTGQTFSPDLDLYAAGDGTLSTTSGAVNPSNSWTVGLWADPTTENTVAWSQAGADYPTLSLAATASGTWQLSVGTTATGTNNVYTVISGGAVDLNQWSEVTATYDAKTNMLSLYQNGNEIAVTRDTTVPDVTSDPFVLGAQQGPDAAYTPSLQTHYYGGQLADVNVWTSAVAPTVASGPGSDFVPVTPVRIMDTRENGTSGKPNVGTVLGPVGSYSTSVLPIEGAAGIPSTDVTAAAISITLADQTGVGFLTAYPDGTPLPVTSTLNYGTSTVTNGAIVPVGSDGDIDIYNSSPGTAQLIIDITGYFSTATTTANASTYVPLADPTRILDTRNAIGAPKAQVGSYKTLKLQIDGNTLAGIPSTGVTGVAINLTALDSTEAGQLVAFPDSEGTSGELATSTLSYPTASIIAASLIVPIGTDGDIDIYNYSPVSVDILGDVTGYYTTSQTGQMFHALSSTRILDTRSYNPDTAPSVAPAAEYSTTVITAPPGINASNPTLNLNVTVTNPTSTIGNLTIYPDGQTVPSASAINWYTANETVANLNLAAASSNNEIDIYNNSNGSLNIIVDTDGYFD